MNNTFFIRPDKVLYNRLVRIFPEINKSDILEWSIEAFVDLLGDAETLQKFIGFPLEVDSSTGLASLPCNVTRILDVYNENEGFVSYNLTAGNHIKVNEDIDKVYINYIGIWVDDEGVPVIPKIFRFAAETYCILKQKTPEYVRFPELANDEAKYRRRFVNACQAVRNSAELKDRKFYEDRRIIRFDMIPNVGRQVLYHKQFGE